MMHNHYFGSQVSFLIALGLALLPGNTSAADGVKITEAGGKLRVEINGELFTEYYYQDVPRPYLYPVIGPDGAGVTRNWPLKTTPNEDHDHPHHRSIWFAHGAINGCDFWTEGLATGKTVHEKFIDVSSGAQTGVIKSLNKLVNNKGEDIGTEIQTIRFYSLPKDRMFDFDVTLVADHAPLTFGDTKEGSMAIRVAESMKLGTAKKPGAGHIVLSTGLRDEKTWGKRAEWCDYYGPVEGKIIGIAMFDYPQNPRFPTWWHVRDYGLFAANPFGVHDFEKKLPGTGDLTVPAGQSITFRHRIYIHEGDEKQGKVAARCQEYVRSR